MPFDRGRRALMRLRVPQRHDPRIGVAVATANSQYLTVRRESHRVDITGFNYWSYRRRRLVSLTAPPLHAIDGMGGRKRLTVRRESDLALCILAITCQCGL